MIVVGENNEKSVDELKEQLKKGCVLLLCSYCCCVGFCLVVTSAVIVGIETGFSCCC